MLQLFPRSRVQFGMKRPHPLIWMLLPGMVFLAAGLLLRPYLLHSAPSLPAIPIPVMPKPNAFDVYVAASRQMQGQAHMEHLERLSPAQMAALVQKNAAALKTLRWGLSLPYQPPPARSINDKFPFYRQQRDLAHLLAAEGRVRATKGDWNGAVQSDLDAVQLGVQVVHGSPIIGCLVGQGCQFIGRRSVWADLDHLNAANARVSGQRLRDIQAKQVPFADTMQEEEWFDLAAMQEYLNSPGIRKYPAFLKSAALSNNIRYMDQSVANARQPYAIHPPDPVAPHDLISTVIFPASIIFRPIFSHVPLSVTDSRTQNALLTVALALRAYRLEHGTYPASLDALVPSYLPAVPDDPFALSSLLHYRRTKQSYVLYSVGPDGKDDGGKPIFHAPTAHGSSTARSRYYVQPTSRGDIVAGVNP